MNPFTSTPGREAIATVEFLPAVSIIMPFTPAITIKINFEYSLKNVMRKAEKLLSTHYTFERAIPLINKNKRYIPDRNY